MLERRGLNRDQDRGGRYRDEDYDDYGDYRPRGREGRDGRGYGDSGRGRRYGSGGRVRDSDYYVDEYRAEPGGSRDAPRSYQNPERGGFDRGAYEGGYRLGGGDRGGYTNRPPYMERYRARHEGGILRSRSYEDGYYPDDRNRGHTSGNTYSDDYYPLDGRRGRGRRNEDDFYPLDEGTGSGRTYGDRYYPPRDAGMTTGSTYEGRYRLGSRESGEYTDPQDSKEIGSFVYLDENGEIIMSDDLGEVGNTMGDVTGSRQDESEKSSRQNEKTVCIFNS